MTTITYKIGLQRYGLSLPLYKGKKNVTIDKLRDALAFFDKRKADLCFAFGHEYEAVPSCDLPAAASLYDDWAHRRTALTLAVCTEDGQELDVVAEYLYYTGSDI